MAGAACGRGEEAGREGAGPAATVNVELVEYGIAVKPRTVAAGRVRFRVFNAGQIAHDLVVIETDPGRSAIPVIDGRVDETAVDVTARVAIFDPGRTRTAEAGLSPGRTYVLICNVPGHFELGMRADLRVT